ncbi:MAG TPA: metallophosphoesterase [bacterium]|nr:metallophosphoesterase [bacterium]
MDKENINGDSFSLTRRTFIAKAASIGLCSMLPLGAGQTFASMAPPPEWAEVTVPELMLPNSGSFKILQVTDLHTHYIAKGYLGSPEIIEGIKSMVDKFKPDIIMNTGDFWANVSEERADTCKWLCKEFAKFKTPWAFAWGNHDESTNYSHTHRILEKAPYSLYRGAAADGNYRIEVKSPDKKTTLWNLIVMNNSRGGFAQEQIDWFNSEAEKIKKLYPAPPPAFLFFHIPIPQYDDIVDKGLATGVKFEKVCHEDGSREALPAFVRAGFVKAMFCGHDHVNDYYGTLDNIRLQYGRAMGGYGADRVRKGGTLITVNTNDNSYEILSVFPDGSSVTYNEFISTLEKGRIY